MHSRTEKMPNYFQKTGMRFFEKSGAEAVSSATNDLHINDDEFLSHAKTEQNAQNLNDNKKPISANSSNYDTE